MTDPLFLSIFSMYSSYQNHEARKIAYFAHVAKRRIYSGIIILFFTMLFISGFIVANDRNAGSFWDGINQLGDFPYEVLSEASERVLELPSHLLKYFPALLETIHIAGAATLVGALLGLFLSLLSTRGLAYWPWAIPIFRRAMDIMRAIPEIVIALVLIFVLGGGPIPAMIAIAFHTAGALGKQFSEVNENVDTNPLDGLLSVGARWFQRMWLGVVPQVSPNYLSYALMRFEINIRASAILGFVGAGGIGYELRNTMSWGQGKYDEAAAIFILLFLTIVFVDQLSGLVRSRLIGMKG